MPSGITHMLLSRNLPTGNRPYCYQQRANTRYFQIGSIAPDLPYASVIDDDFFDSDCDLADLFHFASPGQNADQSPNRLPLVGLEHVKTFRERGADKRACDAFFWFLVGYASHLIADGVCHPFVMDKVGRYEGPNRAEHRALEMGIDVLVFKHFTGKNGHAIEASYAGLDSYICGFNNLKNSAIVCRHFSNLIESVYGQVVEPEEVVDWVSGISRLFCLSTGRWPTWFRRLDSTSAFVFREIDDLDGHEEDYLVLEKPKDWEVNFSAGTKVHFLNDCIPRFNLLMIDFLDKAWAFVYESGPPPQSTDLPAFSLDTGRTVLDFDNIFIAPRLWEIA